MKCFMRGQRNPSETVPNCVGEGIPEADYCYEADETASLRPSIELDARVVECGRAGKVCMQCQGGRCHLVRHSVCFSLVELSSWLIGRARLRHRQW